MSVHTILTYSNQLEVKHAISTGYNIWNNVFIYKFSVLHLEGKKL